MNKKTLFSLMLLCFAFFGVARADVVELGDGGTTNNLYLPGYNYYNYSLTQQIYTACEIGTAGTINSIAFKNTGGEKTRSYNVYMLLTDKETFTGGTDWVAMSEADLVFSGSVTFTVDEWTTITLDTPFTLDGVYNLLVGVADVSGTYSNAPHMACLVYDATSQAIRAYRDASAYDITNPGVSGSVLNVKNQIQLDITPNPDVTVCCPLTNLSVYEPELTAYQARLMWEGDADNYDLEYKKASDTEWSSTITIGGNQYLIQDLQQNTAYNARVRSNCGTGYSYWKTVDFTTLEACPSPSNVNVSETTAHGFTASFTPGNETQEMWFYYWSTSNETPTTQNYGTAMTTTFTVEYNANLNAETTYYLWIGVHCGEEFNWSDPATFTTAVACIAPTDLTVTLTQGDGTVASLAWTENGTATSWDVYLSTDAEFSEYTSIQVDNVPSVELTDLIPETTYYARVDAFCEGEGTSSFSNVVSFTPTDAYTLTVYDGTATSNMIPAYIYYFDDYTRSQYVIPAEDLVDMNYGTINSVKFYTSSSNIPYTSVSTVDVYLMEVSYTTMTGLEPKANGTIVYQGTLDVVTEGTGGSLTIEFTTPYTYHGGNLLVAIENTTDAGYKNIYFYGESVPDAAWGGSNGSSLENVSGSSQPFIPKTTFAYVPGEAPDCLRPTDLTVSDITAHTAELSWTAGGDETAWEVEVMGEYATTWEVLETSLSLVGLDPETAYSVKVRAICDEDNYSEWSIPVNFTTPVACPAPTDLTVTLTPGDGTVAALAWTENGTATEWDVEYGTDDEFSDFMVLNVSGTPSLVLEDLTPETTYYARVKTYCGDEGYSQYSNIVSFIPTNTYTITVNDGPNTNNYAPIYGLWVDKYSKSQFIIPAEELDAMYKGTISKLTFYASQTSVSWIDAEFEVYMTEVDTTAFDAASLVDWSSMTKVMNAGSLSISNNTMEVIFDTPYQYMGGNLLIGVLQTKSGNYQSCSWYGANQEGNTAIGGYETSKGLNLYQFLPKTTFAYTPFTLVKDIVGYGEGEGNYYLIASPIGTVAATAVENLIYNEYDFFAFDQSTPGAEWRNYKGDEETGYEGGFDLAMGEGYLYANSEDVTLTFVGIPVEDENYDVVLDYDADAIWKGWNLVGNPFAEIAYLVGDYAFYTMNADGSDFEATTSTSIEPMEGIFVIAENDGETLTFTTNAPETKGANLALNLSQGRGVIDRAIVRFSEGRQLPKLQLNPNHTKVYIPMDDEDYAVVRSEGMGELPVSFKAENNGTYTLSINTENVEMNYLHLIDNLTGTDVDLLVNPSYSFEANTTDYASRFKLVFATGENEESFAFYSNGSFVISNEGEAVLQVVDVTGRILSSENISGSASVNVKAAAGVYMLRLVNGDNVKVQKVVID